MWFFILKAEISDSFYDDFIKIFSQTVENFEDFFNFNIFYLIINVIYNFKINITQRLKIGIVHSSNVPYYVL